RRLGVYDLALPACSQRLSRRKAAPPQTVAVGRSGGYEESRRKETAGEALCAARDFRSSASGDRRAQAEGSVAYSFEVHRGFVIRRDCERDGLFKRNCGFSSQPRPQPVSEAAFTFKQS